MKLEQIIEQQRKHRTDGGAFGVKACRESITQQMEWSKKTLFELLGEYYERSKEDVFFNRTMILAVWEMINE